MRKLLLAVLLASFGFGCKDDPKPATPEGKDRQPDDQPKEKSPPPVVTDSSQVPKIRIPGVSDYLEDAKIDRARLECMTWEKAAQIHYVKEDMYPTELKEVEKYIDKPEKMSPWGTPYQIEVVRKPDGSDEIRVFTVMATGKIVTKKGIESSAKGSKP